MVARGMLANQSLPGWTGWFFITNLLTSASGFLLPAALWPNDPSPLLGLWGLR